MYAVNWIVLNLWPAGMPPSWSAAASLLSGFSSFRPPQRSEVAASASTSESANKGTQPLLTASDSDDGHGSKSHKDKKRKKDRDGKNKDSKERKDKKDKSEKHSRSDKTVLFFYSRTGLF